MFLLQCSSDNGKEGGEQTVKEVVEGKNIYDKHLLCGAMTKSCALVYPNC